MLSDATANGIIFGTLGFFFLLTIVFMGYNRMKGKSALDKDSYIAARNSQGTLSLSLSYFVSGMGAWVIFAVPQAAVIGGSIALVGYALGTVAPLLLFGELTTLLHC